MFSINCPSFGLDLFSFSNPGVFIFGGYIVPTYSVSFLSAKNTKIECLDNSFLNPSDNPFNAYFDGL